MTANVFAFFFLSTYRRTLGDVKYFQNELTNVESRLIAVHLARKVGDKAPKHRVIRAFTEVERNFVLRKGETTADLSLKDLDSKEVLALANVLANAMPRQPPQGGQPDAPTA